MNKEKFSFSTALDLVKDGVLVCREGWNGKGMYIGYVGIDDWSVHDSGDYFPPNFEGKMLP